MCHFHNFQNTKTCEFKSTTFCLKIQPYRKSETVAKTTHTLLGKYPWDIVTFNTKLILSWGLLPESLKSLRKYDAENEIFMSL